LYRINFPSINGKSVKSCPALLSNFFSASEANDIKILRAKYVPTVGRALESLAIKHQSCRLGNIDVGSIYYLVSSTYSFALKVCRPGFHIMTIKFRLFAFVSQTVSPNITNTNRAAYDRTAEAEIDILWVWSCVSRNLYAVPLL